MAKFQPNIDVAMKFLFSVRGIKGFNKKDITEEDFLDKLGFDGIDGLHLTKEELAVNLYFLNEGKRSGDYTRFLSSMADKFGIEVEEDDAFEKYSKELFRRQHDGEEMGNKDIQSVERVSSYFNKEVGKYAEISHMTSKEFLEFMCSASHNSKLGLDAEYRFYDMKGMQRTFLESGSITSMDGAKIQDVIFNDLNAMGVNTDMLLKALNFSLIDSSAYQAVGVEKILDLNTFNKHPEGMTNSTARSIMLARNQVISALLANGVKEAEDNIPEDQRKFRMESVLEERNLEDAPQRQKDDVLSRVESYFCGGKDNRTHIKARYSFRDILKQVDEFKFILDETLENIKSYYQNDVEFRELRNDIIDECIKTGAIALADKKNPAMCIDAIMQATLSPTLTEKYEPQIAFPTLPSGVSRDSAYVLQLENGVNVYIDPTTFYKRDFETEPPTVDEVRQIYGGRGFDFDITEDNIKTMVPNFIYLLDNDGNLGLKINATDLGLNPQDEITIDSIRSNASFLSQEARDFIGNLDSFNENSIVVKEDLRYATREDYLRDFQEKWVLNTSHGIIELKENDFTLNNFDSAPSVQDSIQALRDDGFLDGVSNEQLKTARVVPYNQAQIDHCVNNPQTYYIKTMEGEVVHVDPIMFYNGKNAQTSDIIVGSGDTVYFRREPTILEIESAFKESSNRGRTDVPAVNFADLTNDNVLKGNSVANVTYFGNYAKKKLEEKELEQNELYYKAGIIPEPPKERKSYPCYYKDLKSYKASLQKWETMLSKYVRIMTKEEVAAVKQNNARIAIQAREAREAQGQRGQEIPISPAPPTEEGQGVQGPAISINSNPTSNPNPPQSSTPSQPSSLNPNQQLIPPTDRQPQPPTPPQPMMNSEGAQQLTREEQSSQDQHQQYSSESVSPAEDKQSNYHYERLSVEEKAKQDRQEAESYGFSGDEYRINGNGPVIQDQTEKREEIIEGHLGETKQEDVIKDSEENFSNQARDDIENSDFEGQQTKPIDEREDNKDDGQEPKEENDGKQEFTPEELAEEILRRRMQEEEEQGPTQ